MITDNSFKPHATGLRPIENSGVRYLELSAPPPPTFGQPVLSLVYNWRVPAIGKKLHHQVARFYLKAWAEDTDITEDAKIFCLQDDEIRRTNVRNVAAENHFYRLWELGERDVKFIRELAIADSPGWLRPFHEQLVWSFSLPHITRKKLEASGHATPELLAQVDSVIAEMNENLHTSIEEDFKPFLDSTLPNFAPSDEKMPYSMLV